MEYKSPLLPLSRGFLLLLCLGFTILWFGQLNIRHLISSDEGRYAEMAREMLLSQDWITPRYNGYKYFEKPPLQTWLTALAFAGFGIGDWQARLWTAVSGFGAICMVAYTGLRVFNRAAGFCAAIVLAASPYWNLLGHFNTLDMGLSFMMTIALCALLLGQRPSISRAAARGWMWTCWAAMALAVLSKGLIGIALPGAVLVLYSIIARDAAIWRRLYLFSGGLIFLLIAAPWFVLVQHRNPEFFDFFFVNEHFRRFLKTDHGRTGALYYFVPVLIIGFLPWLSIFGQSIWHALRLPRQPNNFSPVLMLCIWSVFIFVFFSFSKSKLISYTLPVAPALALLIGLYLPSLNRDQWRRHLSAYAIVMVAAMLGIVYLSNLGDGRTPNALYRHFQAWLWVALAVGLLCLGWAAWLTRSTQPGATAKTTVVFGLAWFLVAGIGGNAHEVFGRSSSGVQLVPRIKAAMAQLPADTPFYSVDVLDHTMPFYLGRTMTMVQHRDELAFGIDTEPQKWLPTLEVWENTWRAAPDGLALMPPEIYEHMLAKHLPMTLIARDERRVVVSRSAISSSIPPAIPHSAPSLRANAQ